jgi:hypothetical protein
MEEQVGQGSLLGHVGYLHGGGRLLDDLMIYSVMIDSLPIMLANTNVILKLVYN